MDTIKRDVLKLSKAEQYEIYEAIESELFGEGQQQLTDEQMVFINERLEIIQSGNATYISPEQLRKELDIMIQ
ncbi:MAG: hypothetical protein ABI594_03955 [Ginsengibacter sp.]